MRIQSDKIGNTKVRSPTESDQCSLYNISYQVGLTELGLPSDSEVINDHVSL